MKILHVISDLSPETGGPVTAVTGMAKSQIELGHDVSIVATNSGINNLQDTEGININLYPCRFPGWRWSEKFSGALPALIRNADIVHIHTVWEYPTYAASSVCRKMGKPYILRPCGMLDKWSLLQSRWKKMIYFHLFANTIIKNAAAIHFTSKAESENSMLCDNARGRFTLPLGLLPSAYQDLPEQEMFFNRYPELKGRRLILFLGRLHHKKQPEIAIKSFHRLCAGDPSIHLVIAGSGDSGYIDTLKQLVRQLGIEGRVTFTGMLDRKAVREAYRAADLFILPSLQENFGISVAEALAAGCPVVISDEVDLASDIRDAGAGLICEPQVETIAYAVRNILNIDELSRAMSENGKRLIREKFTWESLSEKLVDIYEDIISAESFGPSRETT